ncbi:hypothetical protein HOY80DRAFT_1043174 [Tuber brumale]|nr:hypothetical protein HOY80DRAFT_1043174 [Tuber brumale]
MSPVLVERSSLAKFDSPLQPDDFLPSEGEYFISLIDNKRPCSALSTEGTSLTSPSPTKPLTELFTHGWGPSPKASRMDGQKDDAAQLVRKKKSWSMESTIPSTIFHLAEQPVTFKTPTAKAGEAGASMAEARDTSYTLMAPPAVQGTSIHEQQY